MRQATRANSLGLMKSGESPPVQIAQAAIAQLRMLIAEYDPLELVARVATYIVSGDPDSVHLAEFPPAIEW